MTADPRTQLADNWTRHTWTCDECATAVSANVRGDISEVRLVHGEEGSHRLMLPPIRDHFRLDDLPGLADGRRVMEGEV